jgi:Uma2 family endonuclease
MNVSPKRRLTVDEYLDWAQEHPGRYELYNGSVYAMSPEGAGHAEVKFAVQTALQRAIKAGKLPCRMLPDGMTVRVSDKTAFEPDALVYCGEKIKSSDLEVPNPVIVVEVLSPSTRRIDTSLKLTGYFKLPSVSHYLVIDPAEPCVLHHRRGNDGSIVTHIVREGSIALAPPGLTIAMDEIYGGV